MITTLLPSTCSVSTYLEDSGTEAGGLRFYGSPWVAGKGWAFNYERDSTDLRRRRQAIPIDVDVLVTHGPPLGTLDECYDGDRAGCRYLLERITGKVKPKLHVFRHIHEGMQLLGEQLKPYLHNTTTYIY